MVSWSLNGVGMDRYVVQRGTLWRPAVSVRANLVTVPGRHGVINADSAPSFDEPQVVLVLAALGGEGDLEAAQSELTGLLSLPGLSVARTAGGVTASAPARLVSVAVGDYWPGQAAVFTVTLALPTVFLRGPVGTSAAVPFVSDRTIEVPHLGVSSGPVTDAVIRVSGPVAVVSVTDVVTGTGLSVSGAGLASGSYLYLDAGRLRAWRTTNSAAWTPSGTDVSSRLDYPAAGVLQVWARMRGVDPGNRVAAVRVTGTGRAQTTTVAVRAAPSYL